MIIIILAILFFNFTTIYTSNPIIGKSECSCYATSLDDIDIFYINEIGIKFVITVNSWNDLEITCASRELSGNDFKFTSYTPKKKINSLSLHQCLLTDNFILKDITERLGVAESNVLVFESYNNYSTNLTGNHIQGISNVTKLILSNNGLSNISKDFFNSFPYLEWLDLSDNNLILTVHTFNKIPNVKHLDLNNNELKMIDPEFLYNLYRLEFLDLTDNHLVELKNNVFNKLVSLKKLILEGNDLTQVSSTIFNKLRKLENLDISFNNFISIPSNLFKRNNQLRELQLHNNKRNLSTLPDYLLSNFMKLEKVYLNYNKFTKLPEHLFSGSKSLNYINLIGNLLDTLPQNIFRDLQNLQQLLLKNNNIKTLPITIFKDLIKLRKLDMTINLMDFLPKGLFDGLQSLKKLNMENNRLKYIEQGALFPLKKLTIAKLSNNQLKLCYTSKKFSPFYNNTFLKELQLENNNIEYVFEDWTISRTGLRILNLKHNKITTISEISVYQTHKRDVVINIDHNPVLCDCHLHDLIRYFNNEMPNTVYNFIHIKPRNLVCEYANGTVGPEISKLNSTVYECSEVGRFKLENICQVNCTCSLIPEENIQIIGCSYQNMSEFLIDTKRVNFMNNYSVILDLTGNQLTKIPSVESLKPMKVTRLLLSNNHISEITIDLLPKTLTVLELHNNNLGTLNSNVISYLNSGHLKELTLSENPFTCNCCNLQLYHFVKSRRDYYEDLNNITCPNWNLPMYEMTTETMCPQEPETKHERRSIPKIRFLRTEF
ncbi:hypothetical protein M0802_011873 [Mischocyttarus mexicanus]|nr:hypothetical protein M0802_011873 [Mischocyttarus mexicanus]